MGIICAPAGGCSLLRRESFDKVADFTGGLMGFSVMAQQDHPEYLGYHPGAELVFAIVCPLGTPYNRVVEAFSNYLSHFGYKTVQIQLSAYFDDL